MALPITPEKLSSLQARYLKSLEHVYDHAEIFDNDAIRPGECAANVFDFESGLRLIISRERLVDGVTMTLHFSASPRLFYIWSLPDIVEQFRQLSGDWRKVEFLGFSDRGIPHWFIKESG